jgi:hypothetical protein
LNLDPPARRKTLAGLTSARFDTRAAHGLGVPGFADAGHVPHALRRALNRQAVAQKSAPLYACAKPLLPRKWLDVPGIREKKHKNGDKNGCGAKPLKASRRALIQQRVCISEA